VDAVSEIARAVLYEGYLLWPYRRSALKNRQRWNIGSIMPAQVSEANGGAQACVAQTECLLEGATPEVTVTLRFLHVVDRQVHSDGEPVDQVRVGGELYLSWQEAAEREVVVKVDRLPTTRLLPFTVAAGCREQPLPDAPATDAPATDAPAPAASLRRTWQRLDGMLELAAETVGPGVHRLTVGLHNTTSCPLGDRAEAQRRGFASAHVVLRVDGGEFVSCIDPPEHLRAEVSRCSNQGLWPVLVGDEGDASTMLAAPIVLYDWPRVAPESPGDLFDATEIDRMLILNVLSMPAAEQEEMAATDPRAKEILQRCAALSNEELLTLHGTFRDIARDTW
jgi:hypothetical protein